MGKYLIDERDLRFTLFEFLELEKMNAYTRYEHFDRGMYEDTIRLAQRIAKDQLFPVNTAGHRQGCTYDPDTRSVKLPPGYKEAARTLLDAGFLSISDDPAIGGSGMPLDVQTCCWEMFCGAGGALMLFLMLGHGAALMIRRFGSPEQKALYVPKLLSGRERYIIENRYGLYACKPMTQREIAAALGISRSYVSRIEKRALEKLRKGMESAGGGR